MPLAGRLLLLGLLGASAAAVLGAEHIGHLTALADRLADISAQIRIRRTVLLAAGIALGAAGLGFEAILGAFTAGVLVRMLDPSPNWPTPVTDQAGNDQLRPADPGLSRRGRSAPQHSGCR
jgi:Kef-type K+ transport system membrane component KefB